jgi:diketogulonate reductase-like aldo/keto reductase
MGEGARSRRAEVVAVRSALAMGYRLIDSAEMYGDGGAEEVVGVALEEALRAGDCRREDIIVVSKVLPGNASARGVRGACERSLARLRLETIDVYLLHWPGPHPLSDTVQGFEQLRDRGAIAGWGVSNFDLAAMQRLFALPDGAACVTNQVCYSLSARGADFDLLPWQRERALPLMAYCPIDQGALARAPALAQIAHPLGLTPAQLALAWTVRGGGVTAIPKSVRETHLRENLAAASVTLDMATCAALDDLFPPPASPQPLAVV